MLSLKAFDFEIVTTMKHKTIFNINVFTPVLRIVHRLTIWGKYLPFVYHVFGRHFYPMRRLQRGYKEAGSNRASASRMLTD